MPKIKPELHQLKISSLAALHTDRNRWWERWRILSENFLPWRYQSLYRDIERGESLRQNNILDPTGTVALRTLAACMMNGITSPSRQWFKLRVAGYGDDIPYPIRVWLDEVEKNMQLVFAQSNFYNSMATLYLDLGLFGVGANLIYEDPRSIIRCYNPPLGEYYLDQGSDYKVNVFARNYTQTVSQLVDRFGIENVSQQVKDAYRKGGPNMFSTYNVKHIIEPNTSEGVMSQGQVSRQLVPRTFAYREFYWEPQALQGDVLGVAGYRELPGIFPRWDTVGNDVYGISPAMDALPSVVQLQHETKKKAQGLDKLIDPPTVADIQLQHRPTALIPRGITYVSGLNNGTNAGIRPAYQINLPLDMMTQDILGVQGMVREIMYNDLFRMISQLETVRSATEVAERQREKLVLLGPVLNRFESEALDPAIRRVYNIMNQRGLIPEPPEDLDVGQLEIQYESILSVAARVAATAPIERMLQLIGGMLQIWPKSRNLLNYERTVHEYAKSLGLPMSVLNDPDQAAQLGAEQDQAEQAQSDLIETQAMTQGAKQLSETQLGGGVNALELMLGEGR